MFDSLSRVLNRQKFQQLQDYLDPIEMIPINTFSEKEVQAIKQLRDRVADLDLKESDFFFIRWLRARDLDSAAAEEMLRASLAWRKENNIDDVLKWQAPEQFGQEFPYDLDGFDKDGCPVAVIPYGKWDVRKAIAEGKKDVYLRYFDQMCERVLEILKNINKNRPADDPLSQFFVIWDLDGFSLRQITAKGTVDAILEGVKRIESNYPEILKISYTVNAPKVFSLLFALIKPLLTPRTLAKVQLHGSNSNKWKAGLLKLIPADQLLPPYGGTRSPNKDFLAIKGRTADTDDVSGDEMCIVTVDAGETLNIALDVKHANSTLTWSFRTDDFDIGFGLYLNDTEQIFNHERVDSHIQKQEGSHVCSSAGRYTLAFDNTYSVVRAKTLHYMISVASPEQDDEELY